MDITVLTLPTEAAVIMAYSIVAGIGFGLGTMAIIIVVTSLSGLFKKPKKDANEHQLFK